MELNQQNLEQLKKHFAQLNEHIENPKTETLKEQVSFFKQHAPADLDFQRFALLFLDRKVYVENAQKLESKVWELDFDNDTLKKQNIGLLAERDELENYIKANCPDFKSQLNWVYSIPEEPDSDPNYFPCESKEIALKVKDRYTEMFKKEFPDSPEILQTILDSMGVSVWHGTDDEFEELKKEFFYTESWFGEAMYQCKNIEQMESAFKYKEIVHCYNGDRELATADYEEAKCFYGVA